MKSNFSTKASLETQVESVNAHKVANDLLRKVLTHAPAIICILRGPDHIYQFANEKYLHLIGNRDIIGNLFGMRCLNWKDKNSLRF